MVYVDPKNLGFEPYWLKWVGERTSLIDQEGLNRLYKKFVPSCIDFVCEGIVDGKPGEKLKSIIPLTNLNLVSNVV